MRVEHELFVRSFFPVPPPTRVVSQMAARMRDHTFRAGTLLYARDEPSHTVYFIADGQVALEAPDLEPWLFDRGALIGISDATLSRRRARTARAKTEVHAVSIEFEDYVDILEDNFEFGRTTLVTGMAGIHELSRQLAPDNVFADSDLKGRAPLPTTVGHELTEIECLLALRDVQALAQAPVQALVTLSRAVDLHHWAEGDEIFTAGAAARDIHVLVSGRVRVVEPQIPYESEFRAGSILGAHAAMAFDRHPHHAIALQPSTTMRLAKEDIYDVTEDHFGLARRFFAWIAGENERARENLATSDIQRLNHDAA